MAALDSFEDFLISGTAEINVYAMVGFLLISAILSFILNKIYIRYGTSLSNRKKFASNFVLLSTTTTLIIVIVKSSLALSLGLVGALSIVRFRAAIKEPEELAFLFLCIAIGLGLGAGQVKITLISFVIISLLILARSSFHKKEENQNLHLVISGRSIELKKVVNILKGNTTAVNLKRFDKSENGEIEASFAVDIKSFDRLEKIKVELENLSKSIKISYLDKSGIW